MVRLLLFPPDTKLIESSIVGIPVGFSLGYSQSNVISSSYADADSLLHSVISRSRSIIAISSTSWHSSPVTWTVVTGMKISPRASQRREKSTLRSIGVTRIWKLVSFPSVVVQRRIADTGGNRFLPAFVGVGESFVAGSFGDGLYWVLI